jgi:hypothetical protein
VDTPAAFQVLAGLPGLQEVAVQRLRVASWELPPAPGITSLLVLGSEEGGSSYLSLPLGPTRLGGLARLLPRWALPPLQSLPQPLPGGRDADQTSGC